MATAVRAVGYVLRTQAYRETSALVDLFTLEYGRHRVLAKGARSRKKNPFHLQPFSPLCLEWSPGEGLSLLKMSEPDGPARWFVGNAAIIGMYLNELLLLMLGEHQSSDSVYLQYAKALAYLEHGGDVQQSLREFELALLDHLGVGLLDDHTVDTQQPIDPASEYGYAFERGIVADMSTAQVAGILGGSILQMSLEEPWAQVTLRDAKRWLRAVIDYTVAPKQIRSRELMRQLYIKKEPE